MKDITRIHIAKVPYSIELAAKKELEQYLTALEAYTADNELLLDIEIRMTELLLDRGVKQEDVISSSDVAAIREQLGEPREFMTDEATLGNDAELLSKDGSRKLYRNLDNAVLGGVLGGVASYLRVSVVWVRLAFIVLALISFGLFALLYILAWLIMPPARTAAEKLQMAGRPVTLASIRELNESGSTGNGERRIIILRRLITIGLGITALVGALVAMAAMIAVGIEVTRPETMAQLALYQAPLILMFVSGILLVSLCLLAAIAAFAQKFNKRIWISGIIIIALGLASFGVAAALGVIQQRSESEAVQRDTVEISQILQADFRSVKSLSVDASDNTNILYIVDNSTPTMTQRMRTGAAEATVIVENGLAQITLPASKKSPWGADSRVILHGPSLESIVVTNGNVSYDAGDQDKLRIEARHSSSIQLTESRLNSLDVILADTAQLSADMASVSSVSVLLVGHPTVSLGNIQTLSVENSNACAANVSARLDVTSIRSATYDYNGIKTDSRSMNDPCFELVIGGLYAY